MGTDAYAYFAHKVEPIDLLDIPRMLNSRCQGLERLTNLRKRHDTPASDPNLWSWWDLCGVQLTNKWLREAMAAEGEYDEWPDLKGPSGLSLSIRRRCGQVSLCRWGFFLDEIPYQQEARQACRAIARAFGATEVLYAPDTSYEESRWADTQSYVTMRAEIEAAVGPPAPTLAGVALLLNTLERRWFEATEAIPLPPRSDEELARDRSLELEVRAQFAHGMYFVEPVD